MHMYSTCFSMNMLMAKMAQKGNFCLAKSDTMWPMAQMTTGNASLANDGDDSVSGTNFTLTLHAQNNCGGKSVCHLLVVPTVDDNSKLCCRVN